MLWKINYIFAHVTLRCLPLSVIFFIHKLSVSNYGYITDTVAASYTLLLLCYRCRKKQTNKLDWSRQSRLFMGIIIIIHRNIENRAERWKEVELNWSQDRHRHVKVEDYGVSLIHTYELSMSTFHFGLPLFPYPSRLLYNRVIGENTSPSSVLPSLAELNIDVSGKVRCTENSVSKLDESLNMIMKVVYKSTRWWVRTTFLNATTVVKVEENWNWTEYIHKSVGRPATAVFTTVQVSSTHTVNCGDEKSVETHSLFWLVIISLHIT